MNTKLVFTHIRTVELEKAIQKAKGGAEWFQLIESVQEVIRKANPESELAEDYDPTPCCYQHGVGVLSTDEPCPEIADNE